MYYLKIWIGGRAHQSLRLTVEDSHGRRYQAGPGHTALRPCASSPLHNRRVRTSLACVAKFLFSIQPGGGGERRNVPEGALREVRSAQLTKWDLRRLWGYLMSPVGDFVQRRQNIFCSWGREIFSEPHSASNQMNTDLSCSLGS